MNFIVKIMYSQYRTVVIVALFILAAICLIISMNYFEGKEPFLDGLATIFIVFALFLLCGSALIGSSENALFKYSL